MAKSEFRFSLNSLCCVKEGPVQRHARQSRRTTSECWERCKTSVAEVSGLCRFGEHCPEVQNRFLPEPVTHNQTGVILERLYWYCKSTLHKERVLGVSRTGLLPKSGFLCLGNLLGNTTARNCSKKNETRILPKVCYLEHLKSHISLRC